MKLVCIIVPIYKLELDLDEQKSLQQCVKVLGNKYDLIFIGPQNLDLSFYYKKLNLNFKFVSFDNYFFSGIAGYNKLMLSYDFYNNFSDYKYMFIYQTDAFIFEDNLKEWCNKNYDYIGAPFVEWPWSTFYAGFLTFPRRVLKRLGYKNFNLVGNGGLSLRKISSFKFNLKLFSKAAEKFKLNEDYFFSFYINSYNPFFKVAPFKLALKFSFDENPEKSFELNHQQLPMACHAWPKYHSFWSKFIN